MLWYVCLRAFICAPSLMSQSHSICFAFNHRVSDVAIYFAIPDETEKIIVGSFPFFGRLCSFFSPHWHRYHLPPLSPLRKYYHHIFRRGCLYITSVLFFLSVWRTYPVVYSSLAHPNSLELRMPYIFVIIIIFFVIFCACVTHGEKMSRQYTYLSICYVLRIVTNPDSVRAATNKVKEKMLYKVTFASNTIRTQWIHIGRMGEDERKREWESERDEERDNVTLLAEIRKFCCLLFIMTSFFPMNLIM